MAYITKEKSASIRKELKEAFPGWKFSVKIHHHMELVVAIIEAPVKLIEGDHEQINHYYLDGRSHSDIYNKIAAICNKGNYDHSDTQSDYFNVGWYFSLSVGTWEKPFKFIQ